MTASQTQEEANEYFNISIDVIFHSLDKLEERIKQLEEKECG